MTTNWGCKVNVFPVPLCKSIHFRTIGEHFTQEFKQNLNKFQKVPFIHHDEFKLAETIAILRYVTREFNVADHWYPKESERQALADVYLEWQHLNTRLFCASYFQQKYLIPTLKGEAPNAKKVQFYEDKMLTCLEQFQEYFLSDGTFINGNQISFADILAACEIEQPRVAGYDATTHFPRIKTWIGEVKKECNPYYDEAHVFLNKLVKKVTKDFQAKL